MHVLITGARGMLGSSIIQQWRTRRPHDSLSAVGRADVDLRDDVATRRVLREARPDLVIHAAAYVGGIGDKLTRPLPYLMENVAIDRSVISGAVECEVPRFLYVASAAAYPAAADNPIAEDRLFTGPLEPANEGYGLAKLTGLTAMRYAALQTGFAYRSILPSNLYGPRDTFAPERSHLIASTLRKTHDAAQSGAQSVEVWGGGSARREFTYAPDLAEWLVEEIDNLEHWPDAMNVGAGSDHSVREYYELAAEIVGYSGQLAFDSTKPSGVPRRLIDSRLARAHGWAPRTPMRDGMRVCYDAFLTQMNNGDLR